MEITFFPYPDQDIIVLFDYLMVDKTRIERLSAEQEIIYGELISFIRTRLAPLRDQILADQVANNSICMIYMEQSIGLSVNFSYSSPLRQKAIAAFTQKDFDFIFDRITSRLVKRTVKL